MTGGLDHGVTTIGVTHSSNVIVPCVPSLDPMLFDRDVLELARIFSGG